jgi:glycerol-3-phosphate O-acyltransferase / dihydroxyacetone phosphate acyltransferase
VTAWLVGLTAPALVAVAVAGLVDLVHRSDLTWPRRAAWVLAAVLAPPLAALVYVLTRPVGATRGVLGVPGGEVAGARGPRERLVQRVGRAAARGLFRSVEVIEPAHGLVPGPQLWVVSHFGAFSDPIVLVHALPRPPRFLAAAGLFDVPLAGRLLRAAGAIPVHRTQDGAGRANEGAFVAAWEALGAGDPVAIFPEGIANDTSQLAPLRTGAARIALGAGLPELRVVPVGIHYEDKAGLRRRVLVDVGEPLHLASWLATVGATVDAGARPDLVRQLTAELEAQLRVVAPSFTDAEEQHVLLAAAAIALRTAGGPGSYGARADLADAMAELPTPQRAHIVDATVAYRDELDAVGLRDEELLGTAQRPARRLLATLAVGVVLLPPAVVGAVVHAPAVALVAASGRLRVAPVTAATVRPLIALVAAVLTWAVAAWWALRVGLVDGAATALALAVVVLPLWGLAALAVGERVLVGVAGLRRRARVLLGPRRGGGRDDHTLLGPLRAERARLVELVAAARPEGPTPRQR